MLAPLLALAVAGAASAAEPPPLSPREIVARSAEAVVLIEALGDGGTSQGSGFLVAPDGALVTNLHVIDGASTLTIAFHDGTRLEEVEVRAFDPEADLAVLVAKLPAGGARRTTVDLGDPATIAPGSRIVVIANPLGLEQTITEGLVSGWRDFEEGESEDSSPSNRARSPGRLLQISAGLSPGSSGGPVFDDRGQVVGVVTSGVWWGMAGLNFAVPVDRLPALLSEHGAMDLGTFGERLDDFRRERARPYFDEARIAYERGDLDRAAERLERALRWFPRHEEALLLAGKIALETDRIEAAEEWLEEAVRLDERNSEAWYLLGRAHRAGGDPARLAQAEAAFAQAFENDPRHAAAAYELALLLSRRGLLRRAELLLASAIHNEPAFADAYYLRGEICLRQGRMGEAREAFERALWENDDHALSHFGLARLYMELERTVDGRVGPGGRAAQHWAQFLSLSRDDPSVASEREVALYYVEQYFPQLLAADRR